jgi:hypothetical protein
MYRPIKEVEKSTEELRSVWWNPVQTQPLPSWKVWAVVAVIALIMLQVEVLVGLLVIGGAVAFIVTRIRQNQVPVEATSLVILRKEIDEAINKIINQIGPDLGVTSEEYNDAKSQRLLLVISEGEGKTFKESVGVYRDIKTYVAFIIPKGLGYLTGNYNTISQRFTADTRELILWKKVGRVILSGRNLTIAVQGSEVLIPLEPDNRVSTPGFGESITNLVDPFIRESQRRLEANA